MIDGLWRTLKEVADNTGDPEASVSAQLRHLRKKRFGSFVLEKRPRGNRSNGLFEYRLLPPGSKSEFPYQERRNRYKEALEMVWKHPDTTPAIKEEIRNIFK